MTKYRQGFISNSSSSSFIIKGDNIEKAKEIVEKMHAQDYYQIGDTLYTSMISDGYEEYFDLFDLSFDEVDGGHYEPYGNDFVPVEGDRGVCTVYVPKEVLPYSLKDMSKIKKILDENIDNIQNIPHLTVDKMINILEQICYMVYNKGE